MAADTLNEENHAPKRVTIKHKKLRGMVLWCYSYVGSNACTHVMVHEKK